MDEQEATTDSPTLADKTDDYRKSISSINARIQGIISAPVQTNAAVHLNEQSHGYHSWSCVLDVGEQTYDNRALTRKQHAANESDTGIAASCSYD